MPQITIMAVGAGIAIVGAVGALIVRWRARKTFVTKVTLKTGGYTEAFELQPDQAVRVKAFIEREQSPRHSRKVAATG